MNVWTVYACGIHAGSGVNKGKPCPACSGSRPKPPKPGEQ